MSCSLEEKANTKSSNNSNYRFSSDWTSGNAKTWKHLLKDYIGKSNTHLLEIGVYEGRSAFWFLDNLLTGKNSTYTGIDMLEWENLTHNLSVTPHKNRFKFIKGRSGTVLKGLKPNSFDIIYIDGSHDAYEVLEDAILSFSLLKENGIMIFDDYLMFQDRDIPKFKLPKIAIDYFLFTKRHELEILQRGYQVSVRKVPKVVDEESYLYVQTGKNIYLRRDIYADTLANTYLAKKDKSGKYIKIESSTEDVEIVKELLLKIPFGRINLPNSLLKIDRYKRVINKFNLSLQN